MKLEKWVKINNVKIQELANKIGKNRSLVHKYVYEKAIPKRDTMVKIYHLTQGSVSANDFYDLSEKLLDKNK